MASEANPTTIQAAVSADAGKQNVFKILLTISS
jgi:hypothetical protein